MKTQLQRVTREQAHKLKQLGFNLPVNTYYYELFSEIDSPIKANDSYNFNDEETKMSCPPTAFAIQWLEDEMNTIIDELYFSECPEIEAFWTVDVIIPSLNNRITKDSYHKSKAEAANEGLDLALDYLLENGSKKS